uniref:DUF6874 family protein n=1 Tax=Enterocloster hominis (ex Hitch et al. 2024) TaxID=1917870 RepID=UPI001A910A06|nr:hypothetical protein [Lachnoclostridium pacaense]
MKEQKIAQCSDIALDETGRNLKYAAIMKRATEMGLMEKSESMSMMMAIDSADQTFHLRLDEWLEADNFNFAHDFVGIKNNINLGDGFPATDFGYFVPRFKQ